MRVAVVGLGFMGTTHARAWQNIPEVTLTAVVSARPAGHAASGNLSGETQPLDLTGVKLVSDLKDVLTDPTIDAVDLCVPTNLHAEFAIASLQAGKHVLVEKPMALDTAACQRMIAAAKGAGKLLMVAHVIRFWPDYLPLIEAVRSGSLGALRSLELSRQCAAPAWAGPWLADAAQSGGGVFDLLIHDADLCIGLLGLPAAISATGDGDHLWANLRYDDVASVTISGGWHPAPGYPFSMGYTACFEEGTMEFRSDGRPATLYRTNGEVETLAGGAVDAFEAELSYFAECVRFGRVPGRCPVEDSTLAVGLMRQLAEARAERGEIIECAR